VAALEDPGAVPASDNSCPTGNEADIAGETNSLTMVALANPPRQGGRAGRELRRAAPRFPQFSQRGLQWRQHPGAGGAVRGRGLGRVYRGTGCRRCAHLRRGDDAEECGRAGGCRPAASRTGRTADAIPPVSGGSAAGSGGEPPAFIVSPGGDVIAVPEGAGGPTPTANGLGFQYTGGHGGLGLSPKVTGVRVMAAIPRYPNGYVVYMNANGQTVHPYTGRTVARGDPLAHLELSPARDSKSRSRGG